MGSENGWSRCRRILFHQATSLEERAQLLADKRRKAAASMAAAQTQRQARVNQHRHPSRIIPGDFIAGPDKLQPRFFGKFRVLAVASYRDAAAAGTCLTRPGDGHGRILFARKSRVRWTQSTTLGSHPTATVTGSLSRDPPTH
eukprot:Protomagalhaensia_wolfi_Nauph_80__3743@NODE_3784_length_711_cov_10_377976_g2986_i0_p1_GENE_NODE_3784_length_711_cov_10_377976_g2986_i0NODE_3784_length_711_cov_10_377976_g2986_i0_p1_ORF_typecomplete_len143_score10_34_NODE_3784_length_711_cov_10_377976_g2986_i0144572